MLRFSLLLASMLLCMRVCPFSDQLRNYLLCVWTKETRSIERKQEQARRHAWTAFIDSHLAIARALTSSSLFFSSISIGWGDVWFLRPWQPVPHQSWFSGRVTSYRQRVSQTSRNSWRWNFKTHAMNMYRARCNKSLWRAARVACFARRPGSSVWWTSVDESLNDCSLNGAWNN